MSGPLILLPAGDCRESRLVRAPDDFAERDALRRLTALIASVQESRPGSGWEEIGPVLEDNGFTLVDIAVGPQLG